jgi:hypothetical protein
MSKWLLTAVLFLRHGSCRRTFITYEACICRGFRIFLPPVIQFAVFDSRVSNYLYRAPKQVTDLLTMFLDMRVLQFPVLKYYYFETCPSVLQIKWILFFRFLS